MVYGYARISRKTQSIERQIRNITRDFPDAYIFEEAYTGRTMERPKWQKLYRVVKSGDTIVFDSVSRMSRTAADGVETYFELYDKGINLVFLKEAYINTDTYRKELETRNIPMSGGDIDLIFQGLNNYFRCLAKKQIEIAFQQSEKEVSDLRQRTREGLLTAKINGKQIGLAKGSRLHIKKKEPVKERMIELGRSFNGTLRDKDVMKIVGVARNTYYKYKREILLEKKDKNI